MIRPIVHLAILLVAFAATTTYADDPLAGTKIAEVLDEIDDRQKDVHSMEATFRQTKEMTLLAEPEVSTGRFAYEEPNRVIWEYETPNRVSMLIRDGVMTTWYPDLNRAEKIEVKQFQDRIFRYMAAGTGAIRELRGYFDFRFVDRKGADEWILELTPNNRHVRKKVQKITIWIDKDDYVTSAFEWIEGDGDLTRYEFDDIEFNPDIPASRFALSLPAGTRVETIQR